MRDDHERLLDILEAIERIERYADRESAEVAENELLQVWFVHHLQLIGEAARGLTAHFRASHPDIPWPVIIAMRNVLVHQYFGIDYEEVWRAIERDLPELRQNIETIIRKIEEG